MITLSAISTTTLPQYYFYVMSYKQAPYDRYKCSVSCPPHISMCQRFYLGYCYIDFSGHVQPLTAAINQLQRATFYRHGTLIRSTHPYHFQGKPCTNHSLVDWQALSELRKSNVLQPGIELGSFDCEAVVLTTEPPRLLIWLTIF